MKRSEVRRHQDRVSAILRGAGITLGPGLEIEIADLGLGEFEKTGLGLVVRVNNEIYCSKWLTLYPGQTCPYHYHKKKTETFFVVQGEVELLSGGASRILRPGDSHTIPRLEGHTFTSRNGAVIEEVSS